MLGSKYTVQKAQKHQVDAITRLIQFFSYKNALLPKSRDEIVRELDTFYVISAPLDLQPPPAKAASAIDVLAEVTMSASHSDAQPDPPPNVAEPETVAKMTQIAAEKLQFAADLDILGLIAVKKFNPQLFEVRSFAVWPRFQGLQLGQLLLQRAIDDCPSGKLFTLTFVPHFFEKFGFKQVEKASLPEKIWEDCLHCPFIRDCNEIPMVYLK